MKRPQQTENAGFSPPRSGKRDHRTFAQEFRSSATDPRRPGRLLPDLPAAEYEAIKESIRVHGVRVPIVVDQKGKIIDGHDRDRACNELGLYCPREVRHFTSEAERLRVAISLNCHRRHLTRYQRCEVIAAYLRLDPGINDDELGEIVGVSKNTVAAVRADLHKHERFARQTPLP